MPRGPILAGALLGLVWSGGVLAIGGYLVVLPVFTLMPTIMTAFLAPGLVLLAMMARAALRGMRGAPGADGMAAEIDRRVIRSTTEQLVLALAIWPGAAVLLAGKGPGLIMTLGVAFVLARLAYWAGAQRGATLRVFGATATVLPTALVAGWALLNVATGFE